MALKHLRAAVVCAAFPLFLPAPDEARAQAAYECQASGQPNNAGAISCADQAWTSGIAHAISSSAASLSLTVGGGAATTVTAANANAGIGLGTGSSTSAVGDLTLTVGSAGEVAVVEDSLASHGIHMLQRGGGATTADVRSGVTIGTATTPLRNRGISLELNRDAANRGGGAASLTSGAAIHAAHQGLYVWRSSTAQTGAATTIVNTGAISSGVGNAASTQTGNLRPHGIVLSVETPDDGSSDGDAKITNSGGITVSGGYDGIRMNYDAFGDAEVDNRVGGDITATAAGGRGIALLYSQSSGTARIKNAATINAAGDAAEDDDDSGAIYLKNSGASASAVFIENSGDVTATAASAIYTYAQNGAVSVTNSGDLSASGEGGRGIHVWNEGDGAVTVTSSGGEIESAAAEGLYVLSEDTGNGQVKITQAGAIRGRTGVYAQVAHSTTAATVAQRAATDQPLIDIAWTGASGKTAATASDDTGRFAATALDRAAVDVHRGAVVEKVTRYGQAAGIEARIMSIGDVATFVANGDDPLELMSQDAQTALLTGMSPGDVTASPGTEARKAAIVKQFRKLVEAEDFVSITDRDDIDNNPKDGTYEDEEILNWLGFNSPERRTFLRDLLRQGLSEGVDENVDEGEKKILEELTTGGNLGPLFDLLPTFQGVSWYSDAWKEGVRAFLRRYNVGNIRISVNAGDISSRGDGIRAYYATPHPNNGAISITVAAGASVTGGKAGIWVANAGSYDENDGLNAGLHKQHVTVHGTVRGGTDAAVHLVGGGFLTVGETGEIRAGQSGKAILVNDPGPARIVINGLVRGGVGAGANAVPAVNLTGAGHSLTIGLTGRVVLNEGAELAIRGDGTDVIIYVLRDPREVQDWISRQSAEKAVRRGLGVTGLIIGDGTTSTTFTEWEEGVNGPMRTGFREPVPLVKGRPDTLELDPWRLRDNGGGDGGDGNQGGGDGGDGNQGGGDGGRDRPRPFSCYQVERCRLYEALPSILLAMNAPATRDERLAAARSGNGVWTRIHLSDGRSKVESSTRPDVAYDKQRNGVRAGIETAIADSLRVGGSIHGFRGVATLSGGNEAKLSSAGAGAYLTALAGGFHWDMQATATRYEADLKSPLLRRQPLASDVSGTGYAMTVEVGRRMTTAPDVSVTPRVGLVWSRVSLDDFTDSVRSTAVSVESAESMSGRAGAAMEASLGETVNGRMFATFDVQHAFSTEMETVVEEEVLKTTTTERTSVRFGLGGSFDLDDATSLRVSADYMRAGGGNRELGGSVNLTFQF